MTTIHMTDLPNLLSRGKVRDTYDLGDGLLLMVATDRISAFDLVLPTAIPEKGAVLSQISAFWFDHTSHLILNHLVEMATDWPEIDLPREIARRAMVVRRAERIDVECVVRGYITGSAWAEYRREGTVADRPMPDGMKHGQVFPEPLFTPTTKAEEGHDESMSIEEMQDAIGIDMTGRLQDTSIALYAFARDMALKKGIIIADTKFEFGLIDDELSVIDEMVTPDSSRFWDASGYEPGRSLPNFDKQFVRDWLDAQGWDHEPPAPSLPEDVVEKTSRRYREAFEMLTGKTLA